MSTEMFDQVVPARVIQIGTVYQIRIALPGSVGGGRMVVVVQGIGFNAAAELQAVAPDTDPLTGEVMRGDSADTSNGRRPAGSEAG